jgi:predicted alpha/beta-hydrolase family hydrolase
VEVAGLLLTPGAGGDPDHPGLVTVEAVVRDRGVPVRRTGFGAPEKGGRGPAGAAAAVRRIRAAADAWAQELGVDPTALVLGGRSFGGRMCSVAVAEGQPAAGVVLLSYPLHPPGRPETLRVAHLPDVRVPVLAVSGATDPYGTPEELARHLATLGGPLHLVTVDGAHVPTDAGRVGEVVADWLTAL